MESIINKLDNFIRKYHFSLLVKNLIFFLLFTTLLIVFFSFVEYSLWLDTTFRTVIFFLFVLSVFLSGVWYLFLPFVRISRFHKRIDRYKAADLIGKFFPEVQDKFRNLLELNDVSNVSREKTELLEAAILQKTKSLNIFQFQKALDFSRLKRAGFLLLPVLLGFFMLTFTKPDIVQQSFERILKYNTEFEKPAPFEFELLNEELTGLQGQTATLQLKLSGTSIPPKATIFINGNSYPMQKTSASLHQYTIQQLKENFRFSFEANGYRSKDYTFNVIVKPTILNFGAELIYPAYTAKQNEMVSNATDFLVPQGTRIRWSFKGKDISRIIALYKDKEETLQNLPMHPNAFGWSAVFMQSGKVDFSSSNQYIQNSDTLTMFVEVVPDAYPAIQIEEIRDSLLLNRVYYSGEVSDDYGFNALKFYVKARSQNDYTVVDLPFSQQISEQRFYYIYDFSEIPNWREEEIEYYFAVSDNDGVNGSKTTRSLVKMFTMPGKEELKQSYQEKQDNMVSGMTTTMKEARQIISEIDQLKFELMNKKVLNWEDKNKFEQLLQKQENLEKLIENLKDDNLNKNLFEEQMKDMNPELLEKQRQLEEMFNKLFSEEMKEIMRQIQEMLQEMNREQIMEQMEKIQMRSEDIEKLMDQNMELFKQLEFEKKFEDMVSELDKLKEKLDQLNKDTENQSKSNEELKNEQKDINDDFSEIKKEIEELKSMNDELFDKMEFPDTEELTNEISDELQKAQDNLSKNKNSQAGKNQKSGSDKMQKLSEMMQEAMDNFAMESLEEDIENLKMILKNLIHISFAQEKNMELGRGLGPRDPNYNTVMLNQKRLMNRFKIVEDSLQALSKRQIMIQPLITNDLRLIRENDAKITQYLNFGALAAAITHQQYLMQSVNNLALLLIEALQEMNEMMMQAQAGGSCKNSKAKKGAKPGNSPSAKTMRQMQEQLNKQMEELMKQMQGGKPGKSGEGGMSISEQFAKMAAEQEAIRRQLQQYSEMLKSMGELNAKTLDEIMRQMEQAERDLVNKKLDINTIKRQNDILVRLMESEKAELEREKDITRSSRTGKVINKSNPEEIFQYKREKTTSEEIIKSIPPVFNSFYRQRVNNFYLELKN
jgi:hypothetical protein